MAGIPRLCCLVSSLESRPLSCRRSQLPSAVSSTSYRLFTLGYLSWSRLAIRKERDNAVNCHALHQLCDAAEPRHIVDARLA